MNTPGPRRAASWLVTLVLVAAFGACSKKTDTEYLQSAQRLYAKGGDRQAAILEVKNALAQNPKNGHARLLLATLHNDAGNYRAAEAEVRRAQELGLIEGGRVAAELGRALVGSGQPKKALAEIKPSDSFEAEPLATVHAVLGEAFLMVRDFDNARKSLAASAQSSPNHPRTGLLQARVHVTQRNLPAALAATEAVLKMHPRHLDALLVRADLLLVLDRKEEAAAAYDAILAEDRNLVPAHLARGMLMLRLGKYDEAQKDVDHLRKIGRDLPAAHYLNGLLRLRQGKYDEAEQSAATAARLLPDYPEAQLLAGAVAYGRGSYGYAEQLFSKVLSRDPGNYSARKLLAATQIQLRKSRAAFETLEPVLSEEMRDGVVLGLAGDALSSGGDFDRAGRFYERASAAKPDDPRIRTSAAIAQLGRGETEQGYAELEAAMQLEKGEQRAGYVLVTALYRARQYDRALEALKRLEAAQPKNPVLHYMAGTIHRARKKPDEARKSFERAFELDGKYFAAANALANLDVSENAPGKAGKRIEQFLAKNPKHYYALLALADIALREKDTKAHVNWLEQARAADPAAIEPRRRLSAHYQARGDSAKAVEYAQEAAARHPSSVDALDLLGTAQMGARDYNSAAQTYSKLVQLAPKAAVSHYRLGAVQHAAGDFSAAESSFRKAVELDPKYVNAWVGLVAVQLERGQPQQALATTATIRKLAPKAPQGIMLEGEALLRLKRNADAARAFESAHALAPSGAAVVKLYMARWRAGNKAAAVAGLEQWVASNPDDAPVRQVLADAYLGEGRFQDAAAHYEKVAAAAPKNPLVLSNLALIYQALKDPRALETARRSYELAANDPYALDAYGWVQVEAGKVKEGLPLLEKAKSLGQGSDQIAYHLAVALARSGDKARARKELEALLASKSTRYSAQARALLDTL